MAMFRKLFLVLALLSAFVIGGIGGVGCGGDDTEPGEEVGETMEETGDEAEEATD